MGDEDYGPKNIENNYVIPMKVLRPISKGGEHIIDYPINMTVLTELVND